jgi:hypothetical protein
MKDPAFLFYDGDAARDVSHMNRLERGAYFDFIQAQRKFHGITMEQVRKIFGKDFDLVWPAIELILLKDSEDKYYIEWVRNSIENRAEHAEKQRKRIQDYWDKKKKENDLEIPRNNHGKSMDLPLVNENEIVNENENINNVLKGGMGEKPKSEKTKPEKPAFFGIENLNTAFIDFLEMRKKIKKPATEKAIQLLINELNHLSGDPEIQQKIIEQSTMKCWQGFYELKENTSSRNGNTNGKQKAGITVKFDEKREGTYL